MQELGASQQSSWGPRGQTQRSQLLTLRSDSPQVRRVAKGTASTASGVTVSPTWSPHQVQYLVHMDHAVIGAESGQSHTRPGRSQAARAVCAAMLCSLQQYRALRALHALTCAPCKQPRSVCGWHLRQPLPAAGTGCWWPAWQTCSCPGWEAACPAAPHCPGEAPELQQWFSLDTWKEA